MAPKNRTVAFAAAGMAACAAMVGAAAVSASAAGDGVLIDDIRIGERGSLARVALLCTPTCTLETDENGEFVLRGVSEAMSIDVSGRSNFVRSIATIPKPGGARVSIVASETVVEVKNRACTISGREAACIDLTFSGEAVQQSSSGGAGRDAGAAPAASRVINAPSPRLKPQQIAHATSGRQAASVTAAPSPTKQLNPVAASVRLREAAPERLTQFAGLAAPERLAPPATAILASVTPVAPMPDPLSETISDARPALGATLQAPKIRVFDFEKDAALILDKRFEPADCEEAEATLSENAWALSSMIDVGYCRAVAGDAAGADGIFARLLEYTPDNYEALVGRGLIAAQAGDKAGAERFFQDALNALPPIAESNRIVDAMTAL